MESQKEVVLSYTKRHANADGTTTTPHMSDTGPLLSGETEVTTMDCVSRLIRLFKCPAAIPLLGPGIIRELHYWLLTGQHAGAIAGLADPLSHASHVSTAIAILRTEYRCQIPVERLAQAAAMSLSAFHLHFKRMTSLTPGQYQKRLRLIAARRLMLEEGHSARSAAFAVGYESVSQFTREYGRLFDSPPKRDVLRRRFESTDAQCRVRAGKATKFA